MSLQKSSQKSLKLRLIRNLMLSLSLAWIVTLGVGYALTQKTLNQQLDLQLQQMAESLSDVTVTDETSVEVRRNTNSDGMGVEFQIWRDDKMISYSTHAPKEILSQGEEGYSQSDIDHKRWRVFSARGANSHVMVGEDLDVRKALVQGMILSSLWPMLVALPMISFILWLSVGVSLKPLSDLALAINKRTPEQLNPIDLEDVPDEVAPVVQSLNKLFGVVDKTLEKERQFTDNAAHELRTPLTAIKTQAQVALRSQNAQEKNESLMAVNQGVDRASRMVSQLLTLTRLDPENTTMIFSKIDLRVAVSEVVGQFASQSLAKKIDIGLNEGGPVQIFGEPHSLEILISNIIDNAIRYSPQNGTVDIRVQSTDEGGILSVEDHGPGIPEKDRERVFDRFVRLGGGETEGSGIGLAIVKKIVTLHNAKIELRPGKDQHGLLVRVIFAKA